LWSLQEDEGRTRTFEIDLSSATVRELSSGLVNEICCSAFSDLQIKMALVVREAQQVAQDECLAALLVFNGLLMFVSSTSTFFCIAAQL